MLLESATTSLTNTRPSLKDCQTEYVRPSLFMGKRCVFSYSGFSGSEAETGRDWLAVIVSEVVAGEKLLLGSLAHQSSRTLSLQKI